MLHYRPSLSKMTDWSVLIQSYYSNVRFLWFSNSQTTLVSHQDVGVSRCPSGYYSEDVVALIHLRLDMISALLRKVVEK